MKLGFRGDTALPKAGDELMNTNHHGKNDGLVSLEFSTSDTSASKDESTADQDENVPSSIWDVFDKEGNEVSTIEGSEETPELEGEGYLSGAPSASSDERDTTTAATSVYTSVYDAYECCGGGGIPSDDEDSAPSFDPDDLLEKEQSLDPQDKQQSYDTYTASTTEQSLKRIPKDVNATMSATQTEESDVGNTTLQRDEECSEVEAQHMPQGEVLLRVGTNDLISTEETMDGTRALTANTEEKQSSLLRNLLFNRSSVNKNVFGRTRSFRRPSHGFETREEPNEVSGDAIAVEDAPRDGDFEQQEPPNKEGIFQNAATFGAVSLLIASMLAADRAGALTPDASKEVKDNNSEPPSLLMDRQMYEKETLKGQPGKARINRWRIFNSKPRDSTNEADPVRMAETPQVGLDRWNSLNAKAQNHANQVNQSTGEWAEENEEVETPSNQDRPEAKTWAIGQRIEQAKAKSEARRCSERKKQMQTVDQQMKEKRKLGDPRRSSAQHKASRRSNVRYTPTPLCASIDIIDTIFGDAWESQPTRNVTTRKNSMEKRRGHRKKSRKSSSPYRRRSSATHPLCGVGLAFQRNKSVETRQRSNSKRRLAHRKASNRGDKKLQVPSMQHDNRSLRRSISMSRAAVPPLCGAVVPFSLIDDDENRLRREYRRTSSLRDASETIARPPRQDESDFKRRTSPQTKSTWRSRVLGKHRGQESKEKHRPIPGMLPTSKPDVV